jgi:hypothetical protein
MSKSNKKVEQLFGKFRDDWDNEEPLTGHGQRFLDRLEPNRKKTPTIKLVWPVAAAILLLVGLFVTYKQPSAPVMTAEAQQTQRYFSAIIEQEMARIESEDSPETQRLVKDALYRMQVLEKDYENLTKELMKNGENKRIIQAMVTNLQTRIAFLQEVLIQIENIKKINQNYHESNAV